MTDQTALRVLILTDIHHVTTGEELGDAGAPLPRPNRAELVRRALEDAKRRGGFDVIAVLGDVLNAGMPVGAAHSLSEVADQIRAAAPDTLVLVSAGNHDDNADRVHAALGTGPGLHEITAPDGTRYRFVAFSDRYVENRAARGERDLQLLADLPADDVPLVVLQHNPMNPTIEDEYPYMLTNREQVLDSYERAGVMLSLSGHFHRGQPLNELRGVRYFTAKALVDPPHHYTLLTLRGRSVDLEERTLARELDAPLVDVHCHTEFAYCGTSITAAAAVERAEDFGVSMLYLTEHAPQLYCRKEDFWEAQHLIHPSLWRRAEHSRIDAFREVVAPLLSDRVRVGLEVELDNDGDLTLHDEDRQWARILVGAIHWLPKHCAELTDAEMISLFMRTNERLLLRDVDVLAHPWRIFRRAKRAIPVERYGEFARMLAETHTAAEINFHTNTPDPAFFAACVEAGAKIAFGSDAHELYEAANLSACVAMLRDVAPGRDLADVLYLP